MEGLKGLVWREKEALGENQVILNSTSRHSDYDGVRQQQQGRKLDPRTLEYHFRTLKDTICLSTDKTDTVTHSHHVCSSQPLCSAPLTSLCFAFVKNIMSVWINSFPGSFNDTVHASFLSAILLTSPSFLPSP